MNDALPGHEIYDGYVSIPYLRQTPVVGGRFETRVASIRFRCISPDCVNTDGQEEHKGHGKYMTVTGGGTRMFNAPALLLPVDDIALCEGEFDALTSTLAGVPAIGVPGVDTWQPFWRLPLLGYRTVWVPFDGDPAGRKFAEKIAKQLPNSKLLPMPPGEDVTSFVMKEGVEAYLSKMR